VAVVNSFPASLPSSASGRMLSRGQRSGAAEPQGCTGWVLPGDAHHATGGTVEQDVDSAFSRAVSAGPAQRRASFAGTLCGRSAGSTELPTAFVGLGLVASVKRSSRTRSSGHRRAPGGTARDLVAAGLCGTDRLVDQGRAPDGRM
jgi:hypothetical protein